MNGLFITFEGGDGAGKSTQILMLKDWLKKRGFEVVVTREPGGTNISEKIREIIIDKNNVEMGFMTETLLYAASRAQHVEQVIKPAIESGKIVLCDRFLDSSFAYQGFARNIGIEIIDEVNKFATFGIEPDLTIFFDISPEQARVRKEKLLNQGKELDRLELEKADFHTKVYNGYKKLADMFPKRIKTVDASMSVEDLHNVITEIVNAFGLLES